MVDERARRAPGRWRLWLLPPALVPLLILAPWTEFWAPVPGALLLGGSLVFTMIIRVREAAAARRWLADPLGPPRDA